MFRAWLGIACLPLAASPALASYGCVVTPAAGARMTTLRIAPFAYAPARMALERGRTVLLERRGAFGWAVVYAWPSGEPCCADLSRAISGWAPESDLDDCG
jgi:hypothetical protein